MDNVINDRYHFYSVEEITAPKSGEVIRDAFWLVDDHKRVAFYDFSGGSRPQCDLDRGEAEMILLSDSGSWASGIIQIPIAFLPIPSERVRKVRRWMSVR